MPIDDNGKPELAQWFCPPYGRPTSSSEVTAIADLYRVAALTAFGSGQCQEAGPDTRSGDKEGA
ncbi:hypothetical protein ACUN0C_05115 [Faunimonas sp. B44]|uniref:hypothetical protein n=1 Tax=Faunimonas sp. B44 TaxID=3461493 RepID=UPI0040443646